MGLLDIAYQGGYATGQAKRSEYDMELARRKAELDRQAAENQIERDFRAQTQALSRQWQAEDLDRARSDRKEELAAELRVKDVAMEAAKEQAAREEALRRQELAARLADSEANRQANAQTRQDTIAMELEKLAQAKEEAGASRAEKKRLADQEASLARELRQAQETGATERTRIAAEAAGKRAEIGADTRLTIADISNQKKQGKALAKQGLKDLGSNDESAIDAVVEQLPDDKRAEFLDMVDQDQIQNGTSRRSAYVDALAQILESMKE